MNRAHHTNDQPRRSFQQRRILAALAALPFLYLVAVMIRYHLDFPYLDQWEFVPLLEKSYAAHVTLGDLWAQHNEHRLIFPRFIMLVLAHASRWNIAWELAVNVVLGAGIFVSLVCLLKQTEKALASARLDWLVPLASLLVFSMSQWENWMLGWQLQELLNALAVVAGLILVSNPALRSGGFVAALALGVVAMYSFANGLLYWPIGLLALFLVLPAKSKATSQRLAVWIAAGGLTGASYLYDYHPPAYHPSMWFLFQQPIEFLLYVLKYLGAPLVNWSGPGAALAGLFGLCLCAALVARIRRVRPYRFSLTVPYLALALYGVASAVITAIGRTGFGSDQAMSPRYVTFANLLWFSNIGLTASYLALVPSRLTPHARRRIAVSAGLAIAFLLMFASLYGTYRWTERYHYRIGARTELLAGNDLDMLRRIHPEPNKIIQRRPMLQKRGLSVFR